MEFRLLGPLEVRDGDVQVEIRGAKRRALLALLLLHANEVFGTEQLVDQLWGESAPVFWVSLFALPLLLLLLLALITIGVRRMFKRDVGGDASK